MVEKPRRGYLKITDCGLSVLEEKPEKINSKFLERCPEFIAFRQRSGKAVTPKPQIVAEEADKPPSKQLNPLIKPSATAW